MIMLDRDMCDNCLWHAQQLISIFITDSNKMLERPCISNKEKSCFNNFIQWIRSSSSKDVCANYYSDKGCARPFGQPCCHCSYG